MHRFAHFRCDKYNARAINPNESIDGGQSQVINWPVTQLRNAIRTKSAPSRRPYRGSGKNYFSYERNNKVALQLQYFYFKNDLWKVTSINIVSIIRLILTLLFFLRNHPSFVSHSFAPSYNPLTPSLFTRAKWSDVRATSTFSAQTIPVH